MDLDGLVLLKRDMRREGLRLKRQRLSIHSEASFTWSMGSGIVVLGPTMDGQNPAPVEIDKTQ